MSTTKWIHFDPEVLYVYQGMNSIEPFFYRISGYAVKLPQVEALLEFILKQKIVWKWL